MKEELFEYSKTMCDNLKIPIEEVRKLIDTSKIQKSDWHFPEQTNCYAYALGLDVPRNILFNNLYGYDPGAISDSRSSIAWRSNFTPGDLICSFEDDLEALDIEYKRCTPTETIETDRWKIAVYGKTYGETGLLRDFHFARQGFDGMWYHKVGYYSGITKRGRFFRLIKDPTISPIKEYEYLDCYSLKLKR